MGAVHLAESPSQPCLFEQAQKLTIVITTASPAAITPLFASTAKPIIATT